MINMAITLKGKMIYRISLVRSYYTKVETPSGTPKDMIIAETRAYFFTDVLPEPYEEEEIITVLKKVLDNLEIIIPKNKLTAYEPILYSLRTNPDIEVKDEREYDKFTSKKIYRNIRIPAWRMRISGFEVERVEQEEDLYLYINDEHRGLFRPMPLYEIMRYVAFFKQKTRKELAKTKIKKERVSVLQKQYDERDIELFERERPLLLASFRYARELSDLLEFIITTRRILESRIREYERYIEYIRGL